MRGQFRSMDVHMRRRRYAPGWAIRAAAGSGTRWLSRRPTSTTSRRAPTIRGSTDALKRTERFTLINPSTIKYEYTIEDPHPWTRPWSAEVLVPRIPPPLYAFACHEQNYGLTNVRK